MPFVVTRGASHPCYAPAEAEAKRLGTDVWYEGIRGQSVKVWPLGGTDGEGQREARTSEPAVREGDQAYR